MQQPVLASSAPSQQHIERLLQATLVPVEPSPQFLHRLRARLVDLRRRGPSGWMLVAAAGTILVLVGATFAVGLRMILVLTGILSLLLSRPRHMRP